MAVNSQLYSLGTAKALNQRWRGDASTAQRAQDLAWDPRGGWRTGPGYRRVLRGQEQQGNPGVYVDPFVAMGGIWSLHVLSQGTGARQWTIFEADFGGTTAKLCALRPSIRTATPYQVLVDRDGNDIDGRAIVTTPWIKTWSVAWGNAMYFFNGIDTPRVFDGEMCDRAGFATAPGAPTVQVVAAMAASYNGTLLPGGEDGPIPMLGIGPMPQDPATDDASYRHQRRYRVTFINDRGQESPPSAPSNTVEVRTGSSGLSEARHFHYLQVPTGDSSVIARRLWATDNLVDSDGNVVAGRGDVYAEILLIEDNSTKGLEIALDDDALGTTLDPSAYGLWPANAQIGVDFKGTMFLATTDPSVVFYSAPGQPEVFPLKNQINIGHANLGPVTGMYATHNAVVVLKQNAVILIKGDPTNGFSADTLSRSHGTGAPRTVIEVPNVGLMWVTTNGIDVLEGTLENEGVATKVTNIGFPIIEEVARWNTSAMLNAHAVANPDEHEILFWIPTMGSANPDRCYVYHTEVGQWTTRDDFPARCSVNTGDDRKYVYFGSYDADDHPGIHVISRGWAEKDGVDLDPIYESVDLDLGALFRSGAVTSVFVSCVGYGDNNLALDYRTARNLTYIRADSPNTEDQNLGRQQQQYPERQNRMKVYGATVGAYTNSDSDSDVAIWDTDDWGAWRPIVLRYDVSVSHVAPIHEFAVKLFSAGGGGTFMQVISLALDLRDSEVNKTKPFPAWAS